MNDSSNVNPSPPPNRAERVEYSQDVLVLGLVGLFTTLAAALVMYGADTLSKSAAWGEFSLWMTFAVLVGFALRVARRKIFLGRQCSWHQAFSFDALFQGAILLHPQLAYPGVEEGFLQRETDVTGERVQRWFRVRSTSAMVIPLALGCATACLAGWWTAGALGGVLCLGTLAYRTIRSGWAGRESVRLAAATSLGIVGALLEGFGFVAASQAVCTECVAWQVFLLYMVIFASFELSPVPFALGVLELAYGILLLLPGLVLPGLILPLAYRLWRGAPVLAATVFYLPRYKLSLLDLYDLSLADALASTVRPEGGWPGDVSHEGPRLSIVIPAYNEAERLPIYLPQVIDYAQRLEGEAEVIVVDDGSLDGTPEYVKEVMESHDCLRLLALESNQGKGAAVRRGVLEAKGRFVLFADADGATPILEADGLLAVAESGVEVVIASRKAVGRDVDRSFFRDLMGAAFYRVTNLLAVPGIADTQCGFKLFRRVAAQRLFPLMTETGWAFDVEVLFLAQKFGMAIQEVPVRWTAIEGSKVNPIRDAIKMFGAVLRIRKHSAGLAKHRPMERHPNA